MILKQFKALLYRFLKKQPNYTIQKQPAINELLQKAVEYYNGGDFENAGKLYEEILNIQPDHPFALNLSGVLLSQCGQFDEAISRLNHAISIKPNEGDFYNNLGVVYYNINEYERSVAAHKTSLKHNPESDSTYFNLGNAYFQLGDFEIAIESYQHAIKLNSNHIDAYYNLGNAYSEIGNYESSRLYFEKTLKLNSSNSSAANNLARIFEMEGNIFKAIENYQLAITINPDFTEAHSNLLLCLNYHTDISEQEIFSEHKKWQNIHGNQHKNNKLLTDSNDKERLLRIGYVSSDYRRHSVPFFIEPIFREHDTNAFEIFIYYNFPQSDFITDRLKKTTDSKNWRDIFNLSDNEVYQQVIEDKIDILIDLNGHTGHNRLSVFSYKPAPIQISYLGYPNTTGLTSIDYRLTDVVADPPGETDLFHTEELIQLPNCFLCYQAPDKSPKVGELPAKLVDIITLGSFNNSTKINADLIKLWSKILIVLPNSRLILKSHQFSDKNIVNNYLADFQENGVAIERIEFIDNIDSFEEHMNLYNKIDIALDTYPYNGTTTTCEALWMGVPVVTLAGNVHRSRVGASILSSIGFDEFVANKPDQYVAIVQSLSKDLNRLGDIRKKLRNRMCNSLLTNSKQFTEDLEDIYRSLWKRLCEKNRKAEQLNVKTSAVSISEKLEEDDLLALNMSGNIRIGVPDDINLMTPYIILEQEDWFEDEIKFIRLLMQPGMNCIDIGANYGTYSLSMASIVGSSGHIWAFEPTSKIIPYLDWSIKDNDFSNVSLVQAGLSDYQGHAYLNIEQNTELNSLVLEPEGNTEKIDVTTLDHCMDKYIWDRIDFIKIDAEGHEANIINGAKRLLETHSPLLMFEIKQGDSFNLELVEQFQKLGYQSYRLVPSLNILIPLESLNNIDDSQLNLFCCKSDLANNLRSRGLLVDRTEIQIDEGEVNSTSWINYISKFPYSTGNMDIWKSADNTNEDYLYALSCYAHSKGDNPELSYKYLLISCSLLQEITEKNMNISYLQSYARVLFELGCQVRCLGVLEQLLNIFFNEAKIHIDKPFLAVSSRFELFEPGDNLLHWCLASTIEQTEKLRSFSSYFTGESSLHYIEQLEALGFNTPEMERRRQLVLMRSGKQDYPEYNQIFLEAEDFNLNFDYWNH